MRQVVVVRQVLGGDFAEPCVSHRRRVVPLTTQLRDYVAASLLGRLETYREVDLVLGDESDPDGLARCPLMTEEEVGKLARLGVRIGHFHPPHRPDELSWHLP